MKRLRIAVFGYHKLGIEVAKHLAPTPCELLVVDNTDDNLARAAERGHATLKCDYTDDLELARAGIGRDIDLIFCLLPDEAQNVFLTISARALDARLTIVAVSDSPGSEQKLRAAGADKVIDPFDIAGRRISDLLVRPTVVDVLDQTVFGAADLEIAEVAVTREGRLIGRRLQEANRLAGGRLVIVGLVRSGADRELRFALEAPEYVLTSGDVLMVVGPAADVQGFRAETAAADAGRAV